MTTFATSAREIRGAGYCGGSAGAPQDRVVRAARRSAGIARHGASRTALDLIVGAQGMLRAGLAALCTTPAPVCRMKMCPLPNGVVPTPSQAGFEHLAPPPQWIARRPSVRASVDQPRPLPRGSRRRTRCARRRRSRRGHLRSRSLEVRWRSCQDAVRDDGRKRHCARAALRARRARFPLPNGVAKIVIELPEHEELSRIGEPGLGRCRAGSSPRGATGLRPSCAADSWRLGRWRRCELSHTRRADECPFLCHLLLELSPAVAGDRTTYAEVFERRWEDELAAGPGRTSEVLPRGVSDS